MSEEQVNLVNAAITGAVENLPDNITVLTGNTLPDGTLETKTLTQAQYIDSIARGTRFSNLEGTTLAVATMKRAVIQFILKSGILAARMTAASLSTLVVNVQTWMNTLRANLRRPPYNMSPQSIEYVISVINLLAYYIIWQILSEFGLQIVKGCAGLAENFVTALSNISFPDVSNLLLHVGVGTARMATGTGGGRKRKTRKKTKKRKRKQTKHQKRKRKTRGKKKNKRKTRKH